MPIDQSFSVSNTGIGVETLGRATDGFLAELSRRTGIFLKRKPVNSHTPTLTIHAIRPRQKVQRLDEDESYQLVISASGANLTAPTPLGILHGLQTFLQLVETTASGFSVPVVTIKDSPRFAWRGLIIDVGHFIPIEALKRNLDGMAPVLHLHLYDNEGFRIESKSFPKLQKEGSDGLYYTRIGNLRSHFRRDERHCQK